MLISSAEAKQVWHDKGLLYINWILYKKTVLHSSLSLRHCLVTARRREQELLRLVGKYYLPIDSEAYIWTTTTRIFLTIPQVSGKRTAHTPHFRARYMHARVYACITSSMCVVLLYSITYNLCGIGVVEAATSATCWLYSKHSDVMGRDCRYNKKWVVGRCSFAC